MKKLLIHVILAVIAISLLCCGRNAHEWRTIVRVVDGDTLVLDGGERVRLLGVDTPEKFDGPKLERDARKSGLDKKTIQEMGERTSAFTKSICEGGAAGWSTATGDMTNTDERRQLSILRTARCSMKFFKSKASARTMHMNITNRAGSISKSKP